MERRLSLSDHDGNDNLDSDFHFVFFLIAEDERRNEMQKQQANEDQKKELKE